MGIIAGEKAMIMTFGAIKVGKTVDALMSFPRALFICARGALKGGIGVAGFEPPDGAIRDVATLPDMIALVEAAGKLPEKSRPDAVVIDDYSLYVAREVARLEKTSSGFDLWGFVYRFTLALRETARKAGCHVVFTMHELPPKIENGIAYAGTVALPGKKLPYDVPAAADMVLRAQPVEAALGSGIGWPIVYRCNPTDSQWRTGDRHNVTPDYSPMNLGEILRLVAREAKAPAGWAPRRAPGLEWHESWVENAAESIRASGIADMKKARDVLRALHEACLKKDPDERHAAWAMRDAWDRAVLRNALSAHRRQYFGV